MARTARYAFNEIVVEPLTKEYGKAWFECVKSYLMAQDIWEVIDGTFKRPHEDDEDHNENYVRWKKMNAAALHAIHISCTPESLTHIRGVSEAKEAWHILSNTYNSAQPQLPPQVIEERVDFIEGNLYKAICKNKWGDAYVFIRQQQHPSALGEKLTIEGQTALHLAVEFGHVDLLKKLVTVVPPEYLERRDHYGSTPLSTAAALLGEDMTEIVECMVNKNPSTLSIPNSHGTLPVTLAFKHGKKEMGRYLYYETPLECLKPEPENKSQGPQLLFWCFVGGYLDFALDLLRRCEELLLAKTEWPAPIVTIARMPPAFAFANETKFVFWKRWIYKYKNEQTTTATNSVRVDIQQQDQIKRVPGPGLMQKIISPIYNILGMNKIHEMKLQHAQAKEILRLVGKNVNVFSRDQQAIVAKALIEAARAGFYEFVIEIIFANSSAVLFSDVSRKHLFFHAIRNRQPKVFNLIHNNTRFKEALAGRIDKDGNTMLHEAGHLAPLSQLQRIAIPALQMQSELQWFKEVESVLSPGLKALQNYDRKTAEELFKENHKVLMKEGEKWMKETASSCSLVGTLVVTIMFAAAFTVPGGNDQNSGYPIFLSNEMLFSIYIISDALSFFSSATSVIICLGILNSRYAEEDFLKSLPKKLIISLYALFFSIATMMFTFSAGILLMVQHRYSWSYIPVIIFAMFPVTFFAFFQFPLLMEMFSSTYVKGIIRKKRNQKPKP